MVEVLAVWFALAIEVFGFGKESLEYALELIMVEVLAFGKELFEYTLDAIIVEVFGFRAVLEFILSEYTLDAVFLLLIFALNLLRRFKAYTLQFIFFFFHFL